MVHSIEGKGKRQNRTFLPHPLFTFVVQIQWTQYGIDRETAAYSEDIIVEAMDEYLKRRELVGLGNSTIPSKDNSKMDWS